MTDISMIRIAAGHLRGRARRTPLLHAHFLDEIAGRRVFVKAEALQHTGSFKYRGACAVVRALPPEVAARGVLAASSGNHAQGVALAARQHDIPAMVLMPRDAPRVKIENTRAMGAEVVFYDRAAGADRGTALARLHARHPQMTLIAPYDAPDVIAGQGTCGLEIAEQAHEAGVDAAEVLVCCGGGGLSAGIALALEAEAAHLSVRPVEPEGFDDVARSLARGARQTNTRASGSICDAIVTPAPGRVTFPILHRLCGPGITVSDTDCLRAMALAWDRLKLVLEPGGAVALAAALFHARTVAPGKDVIAVATGGNVDRAVFQRALALDL